MTKMIIYIDEDYRNNFFEKYYTSNGVKVLENRLKNLVKLLLNGQSYPLEAKMYGFPTLKIQSKAHHKGMIDGLSQILGVKDIEVIEDDN